MSGKKGLSGPPGNTNAERHGLATMQRAIVKLGNRGLDWLDGRTRVAKALAERQCQILDDLGGPDAVSTAKRILTREASVTELDRALLGAAFRNLATTSTYGSEDCACTRWAILARRSVNSLAAVLIDASNRSPTSISTSCRGAPYP